MAEVMSTLPAVVQAISDERYDLVDVSDTDGSRLLDFPESAWADRWTPLHAYWTGAAALRGTTAGAEFRVDGFIFSAAIENHVRPIVEPYGEILPMTVDGEPFRMFRCLNTANALDEANSKMLRWVTGAEPRRVRFAVGLALKEDVATEAGIFQLPERPGTIFYARHIAERLLAVPGWTGTTFRAPY